PSRYHWTPRKEAQSISGHAGLRRSVQIRTVARDPPMDRLGIVVWCARDEVHTCCVKRRHRCCVESKEEHATRLRETHVERIELVRHMGRDSGGSRPCGDKPLCAREAAVHRPRNRIRQAYLVAVEPHLRASNTELCSECGDTLIVLPAMAQEDHAL